MSKLNWLTEKIKKHKKLTVAGVVVLALAVGGVAVTGNANKKREEMLAAMNQAQTSKVERRTLVSSVSATGTLTSVESKAVSVNLSGVEVKSVSVQLGDMVEAGQVLCEFDSEDIEENLAEAKTSLNVANQKTQMDLTVAERNLANAREDYDTDLKRGNTDLGVAYNDYVEALEDVDEAKANWDEAKETTIEKKAEMELREEQLSAKQAQINAAGASSSYKQQFESVKGELQQLVSDLNSNNGSTVDGGTSDGTTDGGSTVDGGTSDGTTDDGSTVDAGTDSNDADTDSSDAGNNTIILNMEQIDIEKDFSSISTGNEGIDGKLNTLRDLQAKYNNSRQLEAEYASIQQELSTWQTKYNTAKQNESSYEKAYDQAVSTSESQLKAYDKQKRTLEDTTKSAENTVITKTESLTTAQLNALSSGNTEEDKVEQYQQQLDDCTVEAPISGVISAVNIEAGDTYNGSAIVTIDDISSFEVTTEIDEYDIGKIEKGQKVVIKTNATGDEELEGTVKTVSPRASAGGNDVTYTVIISVDTPHEMLRMDMTAKLSIILESKENVLTVPYEAVQEDESGNFYVEVVDNTVDSSQTSEQINQKEKNDGKAQEDTSELKNTEQTQEAETVSGNSQQQAGMNAGEMPQMPEDMDAEEMPQMPEGMNQGNRPQGMNSKDSQKMPNGSSSENATATRRIYIEKGVESDYYIEIISAEIAEGMEVVVPKSEDENSGNIQMMMMNRGPMGGF